jgi:UDP-2,3-diacylglucosamine hydrolase
MTGEGNIWILGDSHVGLAAGDEKKMLAWIDRLEARKPRMLLLNGDVFHYYIGEPKFMTPAVESFLARLKALRDGGVEVVWIEGNRDFFVRGSAAEQSISRVEDSLEIAAGAVRYFIVHGDLINDHDLPYRFWRRISKNFVTRAGVKLVPGGIARRFVDGVERKLASSNFKHKVRLPVEQMERFGTARRKDGYDVVVFGHFHHKHIIEPNGTAKVIVLPAWFDGGEALVIDSTSGQHWFEVP